MFFSERCKLIVDAKNASNNQKKKKKSEKIDGFLDNLIWIGNRKVSLLLWEYLRLAVNVLTKSPEISDLSKNNFS